MAPVPLSRRSLLATGAAGLATVLTACGDSDSGGSGSGSDSAGGGSWQFTDDRKKKVTAGSRPARVVAYIGTAAALHDFGLGKEIVGVFGPTKLKDGRPDPQAGDLDIGKVTVIGNAWGEFNVEKYASLRPELLVTNMYLRDAMWFVPDDSKDKILKLAPSVGFRTYDISLTKVIGRYADLAESLGADLKAQRVTDAKARFEKASERLRKAAKAKGGLRVLAASASADLFYVSDPEPYADLTYFRSLGLDVLRPDKVDGDGFFQDLSWENADKYPADLIMLDNRTAALQPKALTSKPTWRKLPAVRAGQITPWLSEPRFSYAGCAPLIESLADAVEKAKKVT